MTNTPLKNRQIRHPQKMVPYKNGTACEKIPKGHLPRAELSHLLKGTLKFVVWSWDLKINFSQFVSNCRGRFY